MLPNDTLRSLRYQLDISDAELAAIAQLADANISTEAIAAYLHSLKVAEIDLASLPKY